MEIGLIDIESEIYNTAYMSDTELLISAEHHVQKLSEKGKISDTMRIDGKWEIPLDVIEKFQKQQEELASKESQNFRLLNPYVLLYLNVIDQEIDEIKNKILELKALVDDCSKNRIGKLQEALKKRKEYYVRVLVILNKGGK